MPTSTSIVSHSEPPSRSFIRRSTRRVVIKAGTSTVANPDGHVSLTRLGSIVEQICALSKEGIQVMFVSSGAVGMGKKLLHRQNMMHLSFMDLHRSTGSGSNLEIPLNDGSSSTLRRASSLAALADTTPAERKQHYDSACAAAGQLDLMSLYSSMFDQYNVSASQILVTQNDFHNELSLRNLQYTVESLLDLGIVPIINENDAVSADMGRVFSDNDGLASLCARSFGADFLLLLTDVPGVFDMPPNEPGAKLLNFYPKSNSAESKINVEIGEKSSQGRGGMAAKIEAAQASVQPGSPCFACVVACGSDSNVIESLLGREFDSALGIKGTLFVQPDSSIETMALAEEALNRANDGAKVSDGASRMAVAARTEARKLQNLSIDERRAILNAIADALISRQEELLLANAKDLAAAEKNNVDIQLVSRLKLTAGKFQTLASGIRQIAAAEDPLGVVMCKRELADGLELTQVTVPIGVLMIIFESRPDSLPQISALALASGNGLLLKGGKEASESNVALHAIIGDAIESSSGGKITRDIIALVTSRNQVSDLLALDDVIDLVIPRGSNALVSYIKANTKIPVLGHADGVCHVYVDSSADWEMASNLIIDSKTDYPAACNAMETLLIHEDVVSNYDAMKILMSLRTNGVKCLGGPKAIKCGLCDVAAKEMKYEYGDLRCLVEIVKNMDEAIAWIHNYGSGHTEAIVCSQDSPAGEEFLKRVDAACVFKNCSTRFADGFRFGLGAEVGISTGRIHARGPVGVEGLLTTKWQLRSSNFDYVGEFGGNAPKKAYTHKDLM
uniref:Delta-1-pyrroline-5-carboxylate synthase n=1 Tax=Corethron hystrix TaxID=216773 RepID=A0A7S1BJV7_9STRA|mmetsp:Transcript_31316/g.71626  ORF Transcript_31316/g.71626 Transcript_31316/m.71626 type:complete len:791 (+) Transcript_31316:19-2391(+)